MSGVLTNLGLGLLWEVAGGTFSGVVEGVCVVDLLLQQENLMCSVCFTRRRRVTGTR